LDFQQRNDQQKSQLPITSPSLLEHQLSSNSTKNVSTILQKMRQKVHGPKTNGSSNCYNQTLESGFDLKKVANCSGSKLCKSPYCRTCTKSYQKLLERQFRIFDAIPNLERKALTVNVCALPVDISSACFKSRVKQLRTVLDNNLRRGIGTDHILIFGSIELAICNGSDVAEYDCPLEFVDENLAKDYYFILHFHAALLFPSKLTEVIKLVFDQLFPSENRSNRRVNIRNEKLDSKTGRGMLSGFVRYSTKANILKDMNVFPDDVVIKCLNLLEYVRGVGTRGWRVSVNQKPYRILAKSRIRKNINQCASVKLPIN